ncbi:hypothetical protein MSG28_001737 [Choristoneura fumiferana]|uniref:Uncharacterized protein n=1 Tax=Choristoneura fumiferana TaxID=7141 RepID=A0ACC0KVU0_CHOFU|nr:hypothetical protein MSG28_001737 [Choristoneura fumiferana]
MNLSNKVMQGDIQKVLLVATLALGSVFGETVCQHRVSWWDRKRGACVPCTPCDPAASLVVRYPCEVYRDTVCQPLAEQNYDNKDSDSDYEYYETDYGEVSESEWDVQSTTLVLAASGCVVFFVLVLALWLTMITRPPSIALLLSKLATSTEYQQIVLTNTMLSL